MEQEEKNVQKHEDTVQQECDDSSNESMLLNLYCDSNPAMESDEASMPSLFGKDIENTTVKALDFANVEELLAAKSKDIDSENCKVKATWRIVGKDQTFLNAEQEEQVTERKCEDAKAAPDGDIYNNVQIRTIEVPEDEDLFDFQIVNKEHYKRLKLQPSDDLEKTELYKYLTESDIAQLRSLEVTPYQSRHDSGESEQSDASDGYMSEVSADVTVNKLNQNETLDSSGYMPGRDTPSKEPASVTRKRPVRKPNSAKTQKKLSQCGELSAKTLDKLQKSKEVAAKWIEDLAIPENLSFSQKVSLDIQGLNQYLTCGLCKGYLYEASTVTECMHTFCKNCIVLHCMNVSLHCPVCSILIHPTDPFVNIRLDRMIQDIVYKLLPSVAETEMERIKAFYAEHPEMEPKEIHEPPSKPKISPKDKEPRESRGQSQHVSLLLESEGDDNQNENLEKKFIRVTSWATVANVCTYLKKKLNLTDQSQVKLFCCGDVVDDISCTLGNIRNKFFGDQDSLMLMQYKVRDS